MLDLNLQLLARRHFLEYTWVSLLDVYARCSCLFARSFLKERNAKVFNNLSSLSQW
jgi:hypothetical protein